MCVHALEDESETRVALGVAPIPSDHRRCRVAASARPAPRHPQIPALSTILSLQPNSHVTKALDCNPSAKQQISKPSKAEAVSLDVGHDELRDTLKDDEKPVPLVSLLTRPVMIISNYAMLALLDMSAMALVPLVWSTPIDLGGLSFSPASIGLWLSGYGCLNGVIQLVFFPRVVGRLDPGRVVLTSVAMYVIIYLMFPFENLAARLTLGGGGTNAAVWPLVVLQLVVICITDMGFSEFDSCTLSAPIPSLTLSRNKNRFCVHVLSCRSAEQVLAWCYEWLAGDHGRHPAYSRPHCWGIVVRIFSGERRSGWEFCVCRVPRRRVRRSMRCRTAATIHVEA